MAYAVHDMPEINHTAAFITGTHYKKLVPFFKPFTND